MLCTFCFHKVKKKKMNDQIISILIRQKDLPVMSKFGKGSHY